MNWLFKGPEFNPSVVKINVFYMKDKFVKYNVLPCMAVKLGR